VVDRLVRQLVAPHIVADHSAQQQPMIDALDRAIGETLRAIDDKLRAVQANAQGVEEALYARLQEALFALQDPAGAHVAIGGGVPASAEAGFRIAEDGELLLRGPSLFAEYLGDAAATARARTPEGWFRSGDLAVAQPAGQGFDFQTRAGDALRLGGFLVAPEEIESFLLAQPGIRAAQVVAHEGRAVAFVIPGAGYEEAAVMAACAARLARFKLPQRIVALAEFPTTDGPNGRKVQRAKLREMAGG
jgi:fatty-acyl-CoA synthase